MTKKVKPFLKWIGGKTQIIDKILEKFPKKINNYREIFIGGGSVLFALLENIQQQNIILNGNVYAYDLNKNLINVYKTIQTDRKKLSEKINEIINEYSQILNQKDEESNKKPSTLKEALSSKESYYYWLRTLYNSKSDIVELSALFIILNKTGFRGMYRESKNGFNVPYGNYKTFSVASKSELDKIYNLIKDVKFECLSFKDSLKIENFEEDDFTYMDPPYVPENDKSFVKYNADGFNIEEHNALFEMVSKLNKKNIKFCLSNSNVSLVKDFFSEKNSFKTEVIICKRLINSKKPNSTSEEVIITNF